MYHRNKTYFLLFATFWKFLLFPDFEKIISIPFFFWLGLVWASWVFTMEVSSANSQTHFSFFVCVKVFIVFANTSNFGLFLESVDVAVLTLLCNDCFVEIPIFSSVCFSSLLSSVTCSSFWCLRRRFFYLLLYILHTHSDLALGAHAMFYFSQRLSFCILRGAFLYIVHTFLCPKESSCN